MVTKSLKVLTAMTLALGLLSGCASNSEEEMDNTPVDTGSVDTGVSDTSPVTETVEEVPEIDTVFYFDFDQSILKSESRAALTAHAQRLRGTSTQVRLEGHADERGTREYNMALGERRANAVRDFLVLQGVNRGNIETVSYGEERPAAYGSNESSWAQNRRVELSTN